MKFKDKIRNFINKSTIGLALVASPMGAQASQNSYSSKDSVPDAKEITVDNPHENIVQNLSAEKDGEGTNISVTYNEEELPGYNITYDNGLYTFSNTNGQGFCINEEEFDLENIYNKQKLERDSVFATPATVTFTDVVAQYDPSIKAMYLIGTNQITIQNVDIDNMVLIHEVTSDKRFSAKELKELKKVYEDTAVQSYYIHEDSHREMDSLGVNDAFVNMYDKGRISMMDEIRANTAQVAFALQYYKKTGHTEPFDFIRENCGRDAVKTITSYVTNPKNKDKLDSEETKDFLVKTITKEWIKKNNQPSKAYSNEILSLLDENKYDWISNEVSEKEYNRVVKEMFSNVPNLGDVSSYVDSNFKLNSDFDEHLSIFSGEQDNIIKSNATKDAQTPYEAAKKFSEILHPLKDATTKAMEDGILTSEESKHLTEISQRIMDKLLNKKAEENHTDTEDRAQHIRQLREKIRKTETKSQETNASQHAPTEKSNNTFHYSNKDNGRY